MTIGPPDIPYSERYFVDREEQLSLVLDKVRSLLGGKPVHRRTTAFYGPRGSGKSWLICEINRCVHEKMEFKDRVHVLYLVFGGQVGMQGEDCFWIPVKEVEDQPVQAVEQVLSWTGEQLGLGTLSGLSLDMMSAHIVERCRQRGGPFLVLVDGVDEVTPAFLREFESYFLAPLVGETYVLVVLGGRTRDPRPRGGYTWKMPELKLYSDERDLNPFDEGWTWEQLARLEDDYRVIPAAAPEAKEAGGGYPLSNVVLARYIVGDPPRWRNRAVALQECAEVLLENVDEGLCNYFRALCVLRAFDEDRMPPLLATWFGGDETAWDYQRCRRIREDMVATRLARWRGVQGYVMDSAVRAVLENALWENDRKRCRALHRAAYELYASWVERYPKAKDRWQPETDHHAACL